MKRNFYTFYVVFCVGLLLLSLCSCVTTLTIKPSERFEHWLDSIMTRPRVDSVIYTSDTYNYFNYAKA